MSTKMTRYGLYVVMPEDIGEEEHFLITPGYCLLYTKNEPPKKHEEVKNLQILPALAKQWLTDTIDEIRLRYLEQNQAQVLLRAKNFNEIFEKELQAERDRTAENDGKE